MISIDTKKCTHCGLCDQVCGSFIFAVDPVTKKVRVSNPDNCFSCGHCIAACPNDAIIHRDFNNADFKKISKSKISSEDMSALLLSRRSSKGYLDKPVSRESVERLLEAASNAGSGCNLQSEAFIVVQEKKKLSELSDLCVNILEHSILKHLAKNRLLRWILAKKFGNLVADSFRKANIIIEAGKEATGSDFVFWGAPVIIVVHGEKNNPVGSLNSAVAVRNMEILAQSMGLGTCWAGSLLTAAALSKKMYQFLELDTSREIFGALMVGYPKHTFKRTVPRSKRDVRYF
ncbi:MAG: 4Fe-4S dicluster domain-containing protein [bacterium]|nr:4Fe-4S dicluster domain-containing protein [bacterium]